MCLAFKYTEKFENKYDNNCACLKKEENVMNNIKKKLILLR